MAKQDYRGPDRNRQHYHATPNHEIETQVNYPNFGPLVAGRSVQTRNFSAWVMADKQTESARYFERESSRHQLFIDNAANRERGMASCLKVRLHCRQFDRLEMRHS